MNINTLDAPEVDEELSERPIEGCIALVREWLRLLLELRDGQQVFLPFDFSDEFTRWLTIRREGREATAVLGWSTVEGWAISPSNLDEHAHSLPEFSPTNRCTCRPSTAATPQQPPPKPDGTAVPGIKSIAAAPAAPHQKLAEGRKPSGDSPQKPAN